MYNNPYSYNPYVNPYMMNQQAQKTEVIKVNGHNGAEMLSMAANSSALALDTSAPIVWFIQTDGAGYKTVTPYDIALHEEKPQASVQSLEDRIKRLEDIVNAKSNSESDE